MRISDWSSDVCSSDLATARTGTLVNFLMTGALIAPVILFDQTTLSLFLPDGSAALEHGRHLNHIAVWSFLFFGVSFVISGVVRATEIGRASCRERVCQDV